MPMNRTISALVLLPLSAWGQKPVVDSVVNAASYAIGGYATDSPPTTIPILGLGSMRPFLARIWRLRRRKLPECRCPGRWPEHPSAFMESRRPCFMFLPRKSIFNGPRASLIRRARVRRRGSWYPPRRA